VTGALFVLMLLTIHAKRSYIRCGADRFTTRLDPGYAPELSEDSQEAATLHW